MSWSPVDTNRAYACFELPYLDVNLGNYHFERHLACQFLARAIFENLRGLRGSLKDDVYVKRVHALTDKAIKSWIKRYGRRPQCVPKKLAVDVIATSAKVAFTDA